ncbi:MAG: GNAT family N-acetyltransferase [Bacilli bacterium]|nr:GNAT family N-acetyltransferase [Bacilli bacterium]
MAFGREGGRCPSLFERDATNWCLTLFAGTTPIATGSIYEEDPETYRIDNVAVLEGLRGQKIGSYVVKFLISKARSIGGRKVLAIVPLEFRSFFKKLGFRDDPMGEMKEIDGVYSMMLYKVIVKSRKPIKV